MTPAHVSDEAISAAQDKIMSDAKSMMLGLGCIVSTAMLILGALLTLIPFVGIPLGIVVMFLAAASTVAMLVGSPDWIMRLVNRKGYADLRARAEARARGTFVHAACPECGRVLATADAPLVFTTDPAPLACKYCKTALVRDGRQLLRAAPLPA